MSTIFCFLKKKFQSIRVTTHYMLSGYLLSLGQLCSSYHVGYCVWYKHKGNDPHHRSSYHTANHQSKRHAIHIIRETSIQLTWQGKDIQTGKFLNRFSQKAI